MHCLVRRNRFAMSVGTQSVPQLRSDFPAPKWGRDLMLQQLS
jgi:hypothetical protein